MYENQQPKTSSKEIKIDVEIETIGNQKTAGITYETNDHAYSTHT